MASHLCITRLRQLYTLQHSISRWNWSVAQIRSEDANAFGQILVKQLCTWLSKFWRFGNCSLVACRWSWHWFDGHGSGKRTGRGREFVAAGRMIFEAGWIWRATCRLCMVRILDTLPTLGQVVKRELLSILFSWLRWRDLKPTNIEIFMKPSGVRIVGWDLWCESLVSPYLFPIHGGFWICFDIPCHRRLRWLGDCDCQLDDRGHMGRVSMFSLRLNHGSLSNS